VKRSKTDVVGVALSFSRRCIRVGVNGKWTHRELSVEQLDFTSDVALFPAVRGSHFCAVKARFVFDRPHIQFSDMHAVEISSALPVHGIADAIAGDDAIFAAAREGKLSAVRQLWRGIDPAPASDLADRNERRTLLHWAAHWGDATLVDELFSKSPDKNLMLQKPDKKGRLPFMLALLQSVGVKHDDADKAEKYKQLAKRLLPDTTAGGDRLFESVVALVSFFSACSGETAVPQFRNSWLKGYTKNDVAGWHGVKIDDDGSVLQIEARNCSLLGASTTRSVRFNGPLLL
jgi:hypothetical protein